MSSPAPDPIADVFRKIIEKVYWIEDLEEATKIIESFINNIDDDLRALLLERRKAVCSNLGDKEDLMLLLAYHTIDDENIALLLQLKLHVKLLFLIQCTSKWQTMEPKDKAIILTPLYKASYGIELAANNLNTPLFKVHLETAQKNLIIAQEKIVQLGLDKELNSIIEKSMKNITSLLENSRNTKPN